jgi:para-aminobenzoate synthetase component 1
MDFDASLVPRISDVSIEPLTLEEPFLDLAGRFAELPGSVVLMSGGDLDCARYHILATLPYLTLKTKRNAATLASPAGSVQLHAAPLAIVRRILERSGRGLGSKPVPVAAGLFGYLAYDLKDSLENLPRTAVDDLGLPDICLYAPAVIVVHDKIEKATRLCSPQVDGPLADFFENQRRIFFQTISFPRVEKSAGPAPTSTFRSNFNRSDYLSAVCAVREYIAAGDVYQVNLSQRFAKDFKADGFALFAEMYRANPAPFFAYIHAGDHRIVSTSPERFLLRCGSRVETRPIKGTRPRGKTSEQDQAMRCALENSVKDEAELSMIVDLLRNDLGKVCAAGSVRVSQHKRLEAYDNVYHLVSVVEGRLQTGCDAVDLIEATFPGGSITGCPKIRSMEIIDELEPTRRHVYTGAIGYIGFQDSLDLSVAIRTATLYNNRIYFSVGGGIVFDSDPADEYEETLHKGKTLLTAFSGKAPDDPTPPVVWHNGRMQPLEEACVSVSDLGLQFGDGFFETIRVRKGRPDYLSAHLTRFWKTWKALFDSEPPDLSWDVIIERLIGQNHLGDTTAALKILATRGDRPDAPINPTLLVMARRYVHRLESLKREGLCLGTYPHPRQSPLADYKTLNYLYYLQAGRWALENGYDEALVLNPDGTVSETNTANLLLINGKTVIRPASRHVLAGVMEAEVCRMLTGQGYTVCRNALGPAELFSADSVWLTNSLMGVVPVLALDGQILGNPGDLWRRINSQIEQD